MIDVSIIVVSWNTKNLLLECIESLLKQKSKLRTEIIIIDNASTDGSAEAVSTHFPDVRLICNDTNLGFAKANNIGISQANGRYICLINSDVILPEDCIDKMFTYMDQHPSVGILGPKILSRDGSLQISCKKFPSLWNTFCETIGLSKMFPRSAKFCGEDMTYFAHNTICCVDAIAACVWMLRRNAINQVGLLDEDFFFYGEDMDLSKRFWNGGWEVVFFPEVQITHYGGGSSSNAPLKFYLEHRKSRLVYWKKNYGLPKVVGFILLTFLYHIIRLVKEIILFLIKPSDRKKILSKIECSLTCVYWLVSSVVQVNSRRFD